MNYIPRTPGGTFGFGTEPTGFAEFVPIGGGDNCVAGPWHAYGAGMSFKPNRTDNCEIMACSTTSGGTDVCDPNEFTHGFRLYVGP